ncbi:hypothetical protein P5673_024825 [Acropora cervicornis]|uniref:Uncharacterized protein n=1 Tax=Acropora cervicornis TaxID=6130 RepID=A0AAD9Q306_ACRCE|nr:hypothetical protein P5673_024825 [Acropora cervicornis]
MEKFEEDRTVVAQLVQQWEWKKNLRMNHAVFVSVVDDCQPFLQPGRSPRGLHVLLVEKPILLKD